MLLTASDVPGTSPPPPAPLAHCPASPVQDHGSSEPRLSLDPATLPQARRPALLTGDSSSRCQESRRPAPGSRAAARLLPEKGRGSRWPATTRTSSSTPMVAAKRASFCPARPRGPGVPGAGDNQECPQMAGPILRPRLEHREPAGDGVKSGSEVEIVWGAPTPLQGRLFKFSEVGSAVRGGVGLSF